MTPPPPAGRDRLRELLDAVLDDGSGTLDQIADRAHSSPFHLSRRLTREAGEPPVAMRRRVLLERAAWRLRAGASVTEVALEAGYGSVDGFSRAFARAWGHPPSRTTSASTSLSGHWLPAPNGIHFHPPTTVWITTEGHPMDRVLDLLVRHDLDDTAALLDVARGLPEADYRASPLGSLTVLSFDGEEASLAAVLEHLVFTKEVWLASIHGEDHPVERVDDVAALVARHEVAAPRWLATVRELDRRGAWGDTLVDALCDPPESFVLGDVLAHVLTFSTHRRQLARAMLRALGHPTDHGDPIEWQRATVDTPQEDR